MNRKTKNQQKIPPNQLSVAAFLNKAKMPVVTDRTKFLSAKISETICRSNATNNVGNIGESNGEKIVENIDDLDNGVSQCEQKCKQCKTNNERLKEAKALIKKTSHVNLHKGLLIDKLKRDLQTNQTKNNLYQDFESSFNEVDIKAIRSVGPGPSRDSTFVNKIMASLYKGPEFNKLHNRRAKGGKYNGIKKNGVSPEKKEIIERMLHERVHNELENCSEDDVKKRMRNLNRFIKSAIHNILAAAEKVLKKKGNSKLPQSLETLEENPGIELQELAACFETVDSLQSTHPPAQNNYSFVPQSTQPFGAQGNHSFVPQNTFQFDSQTAHPFFNDTTNHRSYPSMHPVNSVPAHPYNQYHLYPFIPPYSYQPQTSHQFAPYPYPP